MRSNVKSKSVPVVTHEGGPAQRGTPLMELLRTVGTCLLFENTFYEKGSDIASRIKTLCPKVKAEQLASLTLAAREEMKLRHVPLFLALQYINHPGWRASATTGGLTPAQLITRVIQRPDEMGEMISIYWKDGRKPLPAQMKKGLAACFHKFGAFQFAKWDSANDAVRLRDVMFMTHPKPQNPNEEALFTQIASQTLPIPTTWETELSAGKDKKTTWETLLSHGKLGIMAFLMNLRNMDNVTVDKKIIREAWAKVNKKWALPFRYITASRHAPWFGAELNQGLMESISNLEKLDGTTYILVDASGSMQAPLSSRGEATRVDAAASLAAIMKGITPDCRVFWYDDKWAEVPTDVTGLSLVRAVNRNGGWTLTRQCTDQICSKNGFPDRIIIITDEQSADGNAKLPQGTKGYIINTAPYQFGVKMEGNWTRINGFSERIVDWIRFEEELQEAE